jgi:hypothetical protein
VKCRIESEKVSINDGYQKVTAQILVSANNVVQVVSESVFDAGSGDIGVQVDKDPFVKSDKLATEKMVVFETGASVLIPQFKAGLRPARSCAFGRRGR